MRFLAELLFAEPPQPVRAEYQCETSNIVIKATNATEAYARAMAWGEAYVAEPPVVMRLVGVAHLTTIGEELGDGTEICGNFFQVEGLLDRIGDFVPPPQELKAMVWEQGQDTPIGELLSPDQLAQLMRVWGRDAQSGGGAESDDHG